MTAEHRGSTTANTAIVTSWPFRHSGGVEQSSIFMASNYPDVTLVGFDQPDAAFGVRTDLELSEDLLAPVHVDVVSDAARNSLAEAHDFLRDAEAIVFNGTSPSTARLISSAPEEIRDKSFLMWTVVPREPPELAALYDDNKREEMKRYRATMFSAGRLVRGNFAVSRAVARVLIENDMPEETVRVIQQQAGNESDPSLRSHPHFQEIRRHLLDDDEFGIFVSSRISPEKGLDRIPEICAELAAHIDALPPHAPFRRVKIHLAGADTQHPEYSRAFQERIASMEAHPKLGFEWIGNRNRDELATLYGTHNILLHPSPQEGFSLSAIEALAAGLPVLARRECEALGEAINWSDQITGSLFEGPADAAKQILHFMMHPEILHEMSTNAANFAIRQFTPANAHRSLMSAIQSFGDLI